MGRASTSRWIGWWLSLLLAIACLVVYTFDQAYIKRNIEALEQQGLYPIEKDLKSPTGYRWGQRSEVLSLDGCHWVMQTQAMLTKGDWRVREVKYDNFPAGREVHWSSCMHGWLAGLGWLWSTLGGVSWTQGVEAVAPYASPFILLSVMAALLPFVWRRMGAAAAVGLALGMVVVGPFSELFELGDPDHHGMVAVCCLLTVIFLIIGGGGWVKNEDNTRGGGDAGGLKSQAEAKRYFVASGIAGGAGLWISAATQVPVLIGIGLGALGGVWWFRRCGIRDGNVGRLAPSLWLWWGRAGALSSLFFYLLEYFPANMGFRLEVNHPLYAVAWWSGGELLCRITRFVTGGLFSTPGRDRMVAVGAGLGLVLLPLVVLTTSAQTFWVSDRVLWALHSDYIVEFGSLLRCLADSPVSRWPHILNLLPVLVMALSWLAFRSRIGVWVKMRLVLAILPAAVVTLLAIYQVRWMGICCAVWLAALAATIEVVAKEKKEHAMTLRWRVLLALLVMSVSLPWTVQLVRLSAAALRGEKGLSELSLRMGVMRDFSRWLRVRNGGENQGVVLSGPSVSTALIYFGGFNGVGTLYWENKEGLKAAIDIFGTSNDALARELIMKRGITYIVIASWDIFADEAARLALGLRRGEAAPEDTFLARLAKGRGCPFWLRPVYYPAPGVEGLRDDFILVYEVVPEMSREEAALRYAQVMVERGERQNAVQFLKALVQRSPRYLPGWIVLAQMQVGMNETAGFRESFDHITSAQSDWSGLVFEDRIGLAMVLAAAGDTEGLRRQIQTCAAEVSEAALRRLPPGKLIGFILLTKETGESVNRPGLMRQATQLLPDYLRKQVGGMEEVR